MKMFRAMASALFLISAYLCLPAILIVLAADVTLRYLFSAPIRWGQELAAILLFLSIVLALPQSWLKGVHISADFFQYLMTNWMRELVARLTWALVFLVSGILVWQCWQDAKFMLMIDESTPELFVPLAWLRGALAVAAILCGVIALAKLASRKAIASIPDPAEATE